MFRRHKVFPSQNVAFQSRLICDCTLIMVLWQIWCWHVNPGTYWLGICRENMQELGMGGVAADVISAKHKIQDKYLKAESQVGCPYHIYTSMRTYLLSGLICSLTFDVLNAMVLVSPAYWIIKVAIAFCSVVQVFSALKSISKLKTDMQAYHQLDKDGYVLHFFPNVCIVAGTHFIGSYGAVTCAAGRQMKQPSSLLAHLNQLTSCKLNLKAGNGPCGKLSIMVQRLLREVCHLSGMHWLPHQLHQITNWKKLNFQWKVDLQTLQQHMRTLVRQF